MSEEIFYSNQEINGNFGEITHVSHCLATVQVPLPLEKLSCGSKKIESEEPLCYTAATIKIPFAVIRSSLNLKDKNLPSISELAFQLLIRVLAYTKSGLKIFQLSQSSVRNIFNFLRISFLIFPCLLDLNFFFD